MTLPAAPHPINLPTGLPARLAALPARAKALAAIGLAALAAVVVSMAMVTHQGDYKVLFANLSDKDGGPIIEKLTQMNVPYRYAEGSGTILVPALAVYELRMKLSAAGLPKGSVTGYELLDKSPFGQTQGQERINLQRALEGELTRTIQQIASVQAARVHLALPNQNGFFREQHKPSASVVLSLHPGRTLEPAQIAGIVHLVSSSVPELSAKAVSVLDGTGSLLSSQADASAPQGLDAQQVQYLRDVESTHLKRVLQLLEPVVGRDNLRATVTAEIDFSQTESTAEEFKPNQGSNAASTVRATRSEESTQPGSTAATGIPGATSNQPPVPATAPINGAAQVPQAANPSNGGSGARREAETRFEVDKKVSVTRNATGVVRRLNAAVVVNHRTTVDAKGKPGTMALTAEEIDKLTALVQQGIGYNKERGDSVRVINAPFLIETAPAAAAVPAWKEPWVQDLLRVGAAPAALALVGLAIVFGLVRPALKAAFAPPAPNTSSRQLDEVIDGETALPGLEGASAVKALEAPAAVRIDAVRNMAREDPAAVAGRLRGWVDGETG